MGIWTTQNGNTYSLNIEENNIVMMQSYGARLCWMRENSKILDEKSDYYEDYKTDNDETGRKLKEGITVVCEDGENITGYVTHWVSGPASGTDQRDWFIIQPGTYPTYCNEKFEMIIEDL